jgi:hypothetical protein
MFDVLIAMVLAKQEMQRSDQRSKAIIGEMKKTIVGVTSEKSCPEIHIAGSTLTLTEQHKVKCMETFQTQCNCRLMCCE